MWDTLILNPMVNMLLLIYDFLGNNFGLAIVVFTVVVRVITLPLTYQQQRSTQRMQEEQLKLYKEVGFNPLSGCLPTLIQFPIIIGLYQAIIRTLAATPVQLLDLSRHFYDFLPNLASLVPLNSRFLWMDLSLPERLFLPILPTIGIPVLTILVVITSWLSTKLMTPPSPDSQGSQMTQMMGIYMPLLLGYFAYTFASGLALYFVVSNVLQIVQSAAMGKVNWRQVLSFGAPRPAAKK
jgi:YidC/Oxa1 family membrane protein insertase